MGPDPTQQAPAFPEPPTYPQLEPPTYPQSPVYPQSEPPTYPQSPVYPQSEPPTYPQSPVYPQPPSPAYPQQPYSSPPAGYQQPYSSPPAGYQPLPPPYQPAAYAPPMIGYGYDPATGQAYSDKSKVVAGLLQLLPGFFFGLGGIGRLYAGNTALGVVQLVCSVVGWIAFWCGFALFVPFVVFAATWLWAVIDGIVLLAGRPTDAQGRPLRP